MITISELRRMWITIKIEWREEDNKQKQKNDLAQNSIMHNDDISLLFHNCIPWFIHTNTYGTYVRRYIE